MGLLDTTSKINMDSSPEKMAEELTKTREKLKRAHRHNEALVSQVNNLLHFINEQNQRKRDLQQRININPKTGLSNHYKMDQDFQKFFGSYMEQTEQPPGAVILIKLDNNYDIINKTQKPSVSEWIIYKISTRIKETIGTEIPLYHTRDDEFILLVSEIGTKEKLRPLIEEISAEVAKPHIFSGYHITIGCQIGISFFPEHGISKSHLLNNSDIALNYAKRYSKKYVFFTDNMREEVVQKMELQNSIIKALEEQSMREIDKQFFMYLQPVVTLDEIKDGVPLIRKVDAEALIRWNHPVRGMISPETFIPIAEETGLIIIIGKWVLYTATGLIESWSKAKSINSTLAINVSPRQFNNDDLLDSIKRIVDYRNIDPDRIEIEITENSFLDDPDEASAKIKRLKDMGIKIAIDDFGTGFSSVNYLRKLPVDVVKIDRSFITNITNSKQDESIVKAIIAMSSELGLTNIVEGVETLEQIELLMHLGIRRFQGFYFSKSMASADFEAFYKTHIPNRID